MRFPSSQLRDFPTAEHSADFFAPNFTRILTFLMELELKLEWLEAVSNKSGGLAPSQMF